ncbi:LANO_0E03290g1_1 [Lachancea nothofagi CBS 11611]|uniref:LANO_0E03290g1_1 n=1 Tax=Lachancea nothofagi CBS 11611 TaxID=1266666 RepID=A0A1G4JQX3_9SACH|nr:LANO_0E03290g1_1 [Lachancea nothofagi CBS 11611]
MILLNEYNRVLRFKSNSRCSWMLPRFIHTSVSRVNTKMPLVKAACLIIGDEVLNGKITDTNSRFFAQYCYGLGIQLREIVTIGDQKDQISQTVKRLSAENDFIITSGGIGPTHDDITYESIASGFDLHCELDQECQDRMRKISKPEQRHDAESLKDFYRMATLPKGPEVHNHYVLDELWVPIVSIRNKVYILPGIPQLFERLLHAFEPTLKRIYQISEQNPHLYQRYFVKTAKSESQISAFLRELQGRCTPVSREIKIGSYPHYGMGFNTVSILGLKEHDLFLKELVKEAVQRLNGTTITAEMEQKYSDSRL